MTWQQGHEAPVFLWRFVDEDGQSVRITSLILFINRIKYILGKNNQWETSYDE